jgi:hypothetical protein
MVQYVRQQQVQRKLRTRPGATMAELESEDEPPDPDSLT